VRPFAAHGDAERYPSLYDYRTSKTARRTITSRHRIAGGRIQRWQAIFKVSEFIETNPEEVWEFISKWGRSDSEDIRTAVGTCVLEHFLEHHFDDYFSLVEDSAKSDPNFADMFSRCWKFGQSELPENAARFDRLKEFC
jgi:hypothetical protein